MNTGLIALLPAFPLASAVALFCLGERAPRIVTQIIGVGGMVASLAVFSLLKLAWLESGYLPGETIDLGPWIEAAGLSVHLAFRLDALSLLMSGVVTFVGSLIFLYATAYLHDEPYLSRFFAAFNLFAAAMLTLVLADNLVVLLLGWEGVGLCSYLLIGFYHRDPENGAAARKAFLTTRIGDVGLVLALLQLFYLTGSLDIPTILRTLPAAVEPGSDAAFWIALGILFGCIGKSAQLPLFTWLPDAMAGPTPVSALLHAATMVTAGVYLFVRMHGVMELSPAIMDLTLWIGAVTLFVAGLSALAQSDIKKVLAYSTVSQLGYLFVGLGAGAYTASMFHFYTHAFFKALLFLGAGAVILATHHEQDIFRMGGLRKRQPLVAWCFLAGTLALAGFPFLSAGFYSKDAIISAVWGHSEGNRLIWAIAVLGEFVTAYYALRLYFLVFEGESCDNQCAHSPETHSHEHHFDHDHADHAHDHHDSALDWRVTLPLVVLAPFALLVGLIEPPHLLGGWHWFSDFLGLAHGEGHADPTEWISLLASIFAVLVGMWVAWLDFGQSTQRRRSERTLLLSGFGLDWIYDAAFAKGYASVARFLAGDPLRLPSQWLFGMTESLGVVTSRLQDGNLRSILSGNAAGAALALLVALLMAGYLF